MPEREIAYCHACGAAMDVSVIEPFTNVECPACAKHTRVKREFGAYTLMRRHAIGGMSMVFVARDNTLDREVVVKILNREYSADERRIGAFEEEARITASISHPNVVRVFTTGRAFGRFFIAMEFVTGGHFEHHIGERGTIPEAEALALSIEVAEGLKAAHHAGLIHRDIKPGNILLDAGGSAKIVDFGLALVTQGGKAKASEIWATPYYVPPETIESREEDFRSDVYAFGATFYHALAGKPPCDEESMDTARLRQAKREVRPLAKAARWLRPQTCAVIDRCMAYAPVDRFRSYEDLIQALKNAREEVLSAVPEPARTTVRERRGGGGGIGGRAAVAMAVLVVIVAGIFAMNTILGGSGAAPERMGSVDEVPSAEPGKSAVIAPDSGGTRIARLYAEAGRALGRGDHALARRRFAEVRDAPGVLEPTGSWAACEACAMAYLAGDAELARQELDAAIGHIERARGLDEGMRRRMLDSLRPLRGLPPPRPVDPEDRSPVGYLLAILGALKTWEQGLPDRAEPIFRHVAEASPGEAGEWLAAYVTVARDYLADLDTLRAAEPEDFEHPAGETAARIEELKRVERSLRTKGRAPFNVACWRIGLERAARLAARNEKPGPEGDPAKLADLFRECRFGEALGILRAWRPDGPDEREKRLSLLLLCEASSDFLGGLGDRIRASGGGGEVRLRDGSVYPEVTSGDGRGLEVADADGGRLHIGWRRLDPESLINLHRELAKDSPGDPETLRHHERAVAFGLLAGDRERARVAGDKLAELSDDFRRVWKRMLPAVE